jgi:hypothetical protein
MHNSKVGPQTMGIHNVKSDTSTKPSTANEEREPIPSFIKALAYPNLDALEGDEDILD